MSRPRFATPIPKCADEQSVVEWLIAADSKIISAPSCGFCTDCTPTFQATMKDAGLCENPSVQFVERNGDLMGVLR